MQTANSTWQIKCTSRANSNNNKQLEQWTLIAYICFESTGILCVFFSTFSIFLSPLTLAFDSRYPWDWCDTSIERMERRRELLSFRHSNESNCRSETLEKIKHRDNLCKACIMMMTNCDFYIIDMLFSQLERWHLTCESRILTVFFATSF